MVPKLSSFALVAATIAAILWFLGIDTADAATAVAGGSSKLGEGVQDAGATVEDALVGYVGPIASIGGGLVAAFAARGAGGSMGMSAAGGLGTAAAISFIPIAGTTTYQTSGSSGADWATIGQSVSAIGDGFVWITVAVLMAAMVLWREAK